MRGLEHLKGRSAASPIVSSWVEPRRMAVRELQSAVTLDPKCALARAALASAYTQQLFYDATDEDVESKARGEIDAALRLDPDLAEAYLARAQITWTARNQFPHEDAVRDLRKAVEINPNLSDAYLELEKVYYHIGLTEKAVEAGVQVQRLDPVQALSSNRTFRALVDDARFDQVRLELERKGNQGPYARGDALAAMGQFEAAAQVLSKSRATVPNDSEYDVGAVALLAAVYAQLGRHEDAERMIESAMPEAENRSVLSHVHHAQFHIGAALGLLGRHNEAVLWLRKAAAEGYPSYPRFSKDQSLAPLKGNPEFEALRTRLHDDWQKWMNRF